MNNVFQSAEWEQFKLSTGYQKSYRIGDILVLQKNLPLGFSMLYAPRVTESQSARVTEKFLSEIRRIAQINQTIFFRLELDFTDKLRHSVTPSLRSFIKSFEEMQPEHTLAIDLSKSEEKILSEMKPKCRYNIRLAEREDVIVKKSNSVDVFYDLYSKTGKRHGITYRAKEYFVKLLEIMRKSGYASVYEAYLPDKSHGEIPLSSAIIVFSGDTAIYMFGASSDDHKNVMAPYKMQWEMIKEAKSKGYKVYDFFGIAPDDDPKHPWAGVTRFKKQFGGAQIDIFGSYDLIFKPMMYQLFKTAEKIRR